MAEPRLLVTPELTGALNMALDEVLLRAAAESPPVVRVYTWSPPAVSLGYGQPADEIDVAACRAAGVDVTRRLTGGRAVLHHHELTYSVILSAARLGTGRSVALAYGRISGALAAGLARLGVSAVCTPRERAEAGGREAACFATTLGGDLAVDGRKLLGSAQCHRHGGVLQHGSLPLRVDGALHAVCLRRPPGAARRWTCLDELRLTFGLEAFGEALAEGCAALFGGRPRRAEPSPAEWAQATDLAAVYASDEWLHRR